MNGKRIGYIRVSSSQQNLDRQLDGVDIDRFFIEKVSGKDINRPELKAMLDYVRDGDIIYCHSLDRLARNLDDLRKLVCDLTARGVNITFVKENLTFSGDDGAMSKLLLSIMGAFAEFERSLIKERQNEGIELAKKRGVYKGRKPSLLKDQIDELKRRFPLENKSQLAREFNISRETLYRYARG